MGCFALALLSKEDCATVPLVLLLFEGPEHSEQIGFVLFHAGFGSCSRGAYLAGDARGGGIRRGVYGGCFGFKLCARSGVRDFAVPAASAAAVWFHD